MKPHRAVEEANAGRARENPENTSAGGAAWRDWVVLGTVCALVIVIYAQCVGEGLIELWNSTADRNYYNQLVQGFEAGRLGLKQEPPPGLAQLPDPYDPAANDAYRWAPDYALHDLSYYRGRLHLYFGVTPALVLFWPYALTGHYLFQNQAEVVFVAIGFVVSVLLLRAIWRRYFPEVPLAAVAAGAIVLGLGNLMPALLGRPDIYEVPITCAYALAMVALAALWRALHAPERAGRWLAGASLAYGLAIGARPSILFGAVILLAPVIQAWRAGRGVGRLLVAALLPVGLIGAGLMAYNWLRFDNPLEFGVRYQLSAYGEMKTVHFHPRYLWLNLRLCLLEPARWSAEYPFVREIAVPARPPGYGEVESPFGMLANIPVVWLALAAPLAWRRRTPEARRGLLGWIVAAALFFGISVLTVSFHNSMCLRYEGDFAPALVLLGIVGFFALDRELAGRPRRRLAVRWIAGLLFAFSTAFSLLANCEVKAASYNISGVTFLQRNRVDDAIGCFEKALAGKPRDAVIRNNLGAALLRKGRIDEAIGLLQAALQINPGSARARDNLGRALLAKGRLDEAIGCFTNALGIEPGNANAHCNLANALLRKGDFGGAVLHWQRAVKLDPQLLEARNNLAWTLATCPQDSIRNGAKAVEVVEPANQTSGNRDPIILRTLAAAYAQAGRFPEAIAAAQRALALASARPDPRLADQLRLEIRQYQAGSPLRDEEAGRAGTGPNKR